MAFVEQLQDDGNAYGNFSFDVTGGSAKTAYFIDSSDAQYLQGTVNTILGYTDCSVRPGRAGLNRIIPRRHPKFPYLYASKISSLTGVGVSYPGAALQGATQPRLAALDAPPISAYLQYAKYQIGVEFSGPRTYTICNNDIISDQQGSWFRPDGTSQSYSWAPEFLRYCDTTFAPQDNVLQGQQGEMSIWKEGQSTPFTSPPWIWLPDWTLTITWRQVPYRYILSPNSYIASAPWRGRVNQNPVWNWPSGWLLYLGFNVRQYAPPTGFEQTLQNNQGLYTYFNYEQLCDVELRFLITNRTTQEIGGTPTNRNYVTAGHNLLPDLTTGLFSYATRNNSSGNPDLDGYPPFLSAPLECLWRDPDSGGGPDRV